MPSCDIGSVGQIRWVIACALVGHGEESGWVIGCAQV